MSERDRAARQAMSAKLAKKKEQRAKDLSKKVAEAQAESSSSDPAGLKIAFSIMDPTSVFICPDENWTIERTLKSSEFIDFLDVTLPKWGLSRADMSGLPHLDPTFKVDATISEWTDEARRVHNMLPAILYRIHGERSRDFQVRLVPPAIQPDRGMPTDIRNQPIANQSLSDRPLGFPPTSGSGGLSSPSRNSELVELENPIMRQLMAKLDDVLKDNEQLKKDNEKLNQRLDDVVKDNEQLKKENEQRKKENEKLNQRLDHVVKENQQLKKKVNDHLAVAVELHQQQVVLQKVHLRVLLEQYRDWLALQKKEKEKFWEFYDRVKDELSDQHRRLAQHVLAGSKSLYAVLSDSVRSAEKRNVVAAVTSDRTRYRQDLIDIFKFVYGTDPIEDFGAEPSASGSGVPSTSL